MDLKSLCIARTYVFPLEDVTLTSNSFVYIVTTKDYTRIKKEDKREFQKTRKEGVKR